MMRVVFYHVGKGDLSLVLLPSGEAMLIDCYKADEAVEGELTDTDTVLDRIAARIAEHKLSVSQQQPAIKQAMYFEAKAETEKKKKVRIWMLAITHGDRDHILTKEKLLARFEIEWLADNGRDYKNPSSTLQDYLNFRKEKQKQGKYLAYKRAAYNIISESGVELDVLCPNRDIASDEDTNNQCLVLRLAHKGKVFLFAGDTQIDDWVNEKYGILKLHSAKLRADVLNVSHHGSRTFFTPPGARPAGTPDYTKKDFDTRALEAIQPTISFITCSDDEDAEHPHPVALQVYQELTNPTLPFDQRATHVYLSRDTRHSHFVVQDTGRMFCRTSRSKCNSVSDEPNSKRPYLLGKVSSQFGYLDAAGIWVVKGAAFNKIEVSFSVERKGVWNGNVNFEWRVLNNGQAGDVLHKEFYGPSSIDGKKKSSWSRSLVYEGVHLMQCHASADDGEQWANWCVLVCFESSLITARQWLECFPNCIDPSKIN